MSTDLIKETAEKLAKAVTNSRREIHLARVEKQDPSSYTVSLKFLAPSHLERTSLDKVAVLRGGAGRLPSLGDTVVVDYVGGDETPIVTGIYADGAEDGIVSGDERALGKIVVVKGEKVKIGNQAVNLADVIEDIYNKILKLGTTPCAQGSQLASDFAGEIPDKLVKVGQLFDK